MLDFALLSRLPLHNQYAKKKAFDWWNAEMNNLITIKKRVHHTDYLSTDSFALEIWNGIWKEEFEFGIYEYKLDNINIFARTKLRHSG